VGSDDEDREPNAWNQRPGQPHSRGTFEQQAAPERERHEQERKDDPTYEHLHYGRSRRVLARTGL
jgi:hypothetical protein